jgi:hypothetical protein
MQGDRQTAQQAGESPDVAKTPEQAPVQTYEPPLTEEDEWSEEPLGELPARPRRQLFGKGANPVVLSLLGVLLIACGFIGGVLVEKGQASSSASGNGAAGLASRFAALRGGASGGASGASGSAAGTGTAGAAGAGGGLFGRSGAGGAGGATVGEVAYLDGDTLYVTNAEGNTVKVTAAPGASVTKTVKAKVREIRPGETVVVTGTPGANGAISAESIRVGGSGGLGGGLGGGLFGGSGASGRSGASGSAGSSAGGGEPALFGK